ncbi:ROK family protein [uncultured Bacteroides sp.]|uniref:ROK family protein n=1 Tax=uncultured Bacteroides sp. TaxID=162156 RepID=UPI002AAC3E9D|nr:ROK family protein [uncultured Bacteroides sp.]
MKDNKVAIGVDIGGTKIKTGLVRSDGQIIGESITIPTIASEQKEAIVGRIIESINYTLHIAQCENLDIQGIGMGVTGPLDIKNGKILQCPNLPTMDFYPLRETIQEYFSIPVFMNNDANAMILGETLWGAGKGFDCVLGITLGTGLGCAIIKQNKIWIGATETAGEIWISPYKKGIIEDYVSGNAINRIFKKRSGKDCSAIEVAYFARKGDELAIKTWNEFSKALAYALAWSVNLIDPDVIVIGGSIANSMDLFLSPMEKMLRKHICSAPAETIRIAKAQLGDNAGFAGAAALVFS